MSSTPERRRFLRPARPDRRVERSARLAAGLVLFGVSIAMTIPPGLGVAPWDVFHQGVGLRTPFSFGTVVIITSIIVLLLWIPLPERPGVGTLANAVVVGVVADLTLLVLPETVDGAAGWALLLGGIGLNGVATGLYIGAGLGPGPRDGLMTGLAAKGLPVGAVRFGLEATVLVVGWLLGGVVGVGTLVFAVAIGPLAHVFLPLFALDPPPSADPPTLAR